MTDVSPKESSGTAQSPSESEGRKREERSSSVTSTGSNSNSTPIFPVGNIPRTISGVASIATRGIYGITGERPREISCRTDDAFVAHSAYLLVTTIQRKLEESSYAKVVVGLSGGSTPKAIYAAVRHLSLVAEEQGLERAASTLAQDVPALQEEIAEDEQRRHLGSGVDWSRVILFLVDERYVPPDHPDSNQRMIRQQLLGQTRGISCSRDGSECRKDEVLEIPEENLIFPDTSLPLEDCIVKYRADLLRLLSSTQRIDLVTLGLGPDGHIASIFPPVSDEEFRTLMDPSTVVLHTKTDKFPGEDRISLSLQLLCGAHQKVFFLKGEEKITLWREMQNDRFSKAVQDYPALAILESGNVRVVATPPLDVSEERLQQAIQEDDTFFTAIILGASGDLAHKKTYPALFSLFCEGLLPPSFHITVCEGPPLSFTSLVKSFSPRFKSFSSSPPFDSHTDTQELSSYSVPSIPSPLLTSSSSFTEKALSREEEDGDVNRFEQPSHHHSKKDDTQHLHSSERSEVEILLDLSPGRLDSYREFLSTLVDKTKVERHKELLSVFLREQFTKQETSQCRITSSERRYEGKVEEEEEEEDDGEDELGRKLFSMLRKEEEEIDMKREKEERDDVEEDARISLLPLHSYRHGETLPISRRIESAVEESSSSFSFCLRALVSLFFVSSLFSFWYRRYMKKKGQKEEEKERRRKSNDLSKRVKEEHKKRHTRRGVGRGEKGKEKEEKKEREEEEKREEEEEEREEEVVEESELQKIFRGLGRAIILTLLSFTLFLLLAVTSLCGFSDISLISTKGSSKEIKL